MKVVCWNDVAYPFKYNPTHTNGITITKHDNHLRNSADAQQKHQIAQKTHTANKKST